MNTTDLLGKFHTAAISIVVKGLLTGLLYGLLIYLSTIFIFPVKDAPVIWSVNAIPVAVLLFNQNKNWPVILFFCALGLWAGLWAGQFPTAQYEINLALTLCGANIVEIFLLATIIRKIAGPDLTGKRIGPIIVTSMWATALVLTVTSILSVLVFSFLITEMHFFKTVLRLFTSTFLGQVLLLPAILCWSVLDRTSFKKISSRTITEQIFMLVTLFFFMAITLASLDSQTPVHYIFLYMTLPLLVWSAIRIGICFTVTLSIVASLFNKYLASLGYFPFGAASGFSSYQQIIELNVGLIALNVTVLILALVVADQNRIKHDLSKKEEYYQIAINHMSGGLFMLDQERRLKVLSRGLLEKFSLPVEICYLGIHIEQVFEFRARRGDYGSGDPDGLVRARMEKLEMPEATSGRYPPHNGRTYEYFQNHTEDGEIIIIFHEITERIKAEEDSLKALSEAQHANKAKTDFLANMSHELRTPLNAIIGFSEIMAKDTFAETYADKVKEYSIDIHMSGHHLLNIINDILDLSKVEAGMADVELESIHLGECIKQCVTFLDIRAAGAGITIFNEVENTDTVIQADKRMFKQIMVNLLSNAVKFTLRGGSIHISHKINSAGDTTISIEDTGIGMDGSDIEAMMEPFRQADSSLSREFEGTGLGLSLVKSLMDLHDGEVKIKSAVGVGTTVLITFPRQFSKS